MKRKLWIFVSVIAAALLFATPVFGITFGQLDGERHPNVGALLVAWQKGEIGNFFRRLLGRPARATA